MADTIELKIEENKPPKIRCITCYNTMSESRAFRFPICNDCVKDLREIIKKRRLEKEKAEFKLKVKERCAELERK